MNRYFFFLLIIASGPSVASAADPENASFADDVRPLLQKYCHRCHDDKKQEAKIDIAQFGTRASILRERKTWQKILAKLVDEEMPPEEPLPSAAERKLLIAWVDDAVNNIDWTKVKNPGHVTIPRLTRDEYHNTMHDLLGVDLSPAEKLSDDGQGDSGFNNDRDSLFIAPALMEKYFEAADSALDKLIALRFEPLAVHLESEKMFMTEQNTPPQEFGYVLNRGQMTLYDSVTFPVDGRYRFHVRAWSTGGPTGARLRINDVEMGDIYVPGQEPAKYSLDCQVRAGTHQIAWNIQRNPERMPDIEDPSTGSSSRALKRSESAKPEVIDPRQFGKLVDERSPINAIVFPPVEGATPQVEQLRKQFNQAAVSVQRPYEWLRLHGPEGDVREIIRFKGYIADRTEALNVAKANLAKAMNLLLDEFDKKLRQHNQDRLADNDKILAAVADAKPAPPQQPKPTSRKPAKKQKPGNVAIDWIKVDGPLPPADMPNAPVVFTPAPGGDVSGDDAARAVISRFAKRAFRRPVTADEVDRYMRLFRRSDAAGESFYRALKLPLTAILVSPHFLFRAELGGGEEFELNDFQLASRLSYFLWMSMPDDELFELAEAEKLRDEAVLRQQVARLLRDPKSQRFTREFVSQWLGISALGRTVGPDEKKFASFTPELQAAMIQETELFFDDLVRNDRSLLGVLDARQTFLNEALAKHYAIEGVKGEEMRPVTLDEPNRGGVLGMASVLTATSLPLRTSPVVRGKWVLETLLGDEQPPPAPNAGQLPADGGESKGLTVRQTFEQHRRDPQCATCHQRMDPIGFGLENFDPIGRWREKQAGQPIDSVGVLPGGQEFKGPAELKQILLMQKDEFARNMTERMLSFALGRKLQYHDELAIREATEVLVDNDFKPLSLIQAVATSYPFRNQSNKPLGDDIEETE